MQAALPMGANKITGMADPAVSTDAATKNYVDTATAAFFSTGDIKLTLKTAADSGWLLFDDGTFGSAGSGSSNSNSASNLALFTLFFDNLSDTAAPLLTSGGGATTRSAQVNASNAWAANCRMSLPKSLGRALVIAGSGSGLTARALGSSFGAETTTLSANQIPTITSVNAAQAITVGSAGVHIPTASSGYSNYTASNTPGSINTPFSAGSSGDLTTLSGTNSISVTYTNGSQISVPVVQPSVALNAMVKI